MTTAASTRPPSTPPLQRSTAIAPVATIRRPGVPGTTTWRQQQNQYSDEDDDNTKGECFFYVPAIMVLLLFSIVFQKISPGTIGATRDIPNCGWGELALAPKLLT